MSSEPRRRSPHASTSGTTTARLSNESPSTTTAGCGKGTGRNGGSQKWGSEFTQSGQRDPGAEVTIPFQGTGAILVGWYLPTGGTADVFLDGEAAGTVDVYPDEDDVKFDEAVWHAFGLADGKHELRLVVRGEPYVESDGVGSQGTEIPLRAWSSSGRECEQPRTAARALQAGGQTPSARRRSTSWPA